MSFHTFDIKGGSAEESKSSDSANGELRQQTRQETSMMEKKDANDSGGLNQILNDDVGLHAASSEPLSTQKKSQGSYFLTHQATAE